MPDQATSTTSDVTVAPELGYPAFDSDNHYYEAEDAVTMHLPREFRHRRLDGVRRATAAGVRQYIGDA